MTIVALRALAGVLFLVAGTSLAFANDGASPPPFKDFTFKRVKPPSGGTNRITVQIAPKGQAPVAEETPTASASKAADAAPWFWARMSPAASDGAPGRLFDAMDLVQASGGSLTPRLQALQSIAARHGTEILRATIGTEVSPALALAVISVESGGRIDAVSRAGAQGLMQLMPATAERFGVTDAFSPSQNIAGGVALLDHLIKRYEADPLLVLAAYNAGEGSVRDHGGVPPFAETRDYIPKVLAAYSVARSLCVTPPLMLSDGCVFAGAQG